METMQLKRYYAFRFTQMRLHFTAAKHDPFRLESEIQMSVWIGLYDLIFFLTLYH